MRPRTAVALLGLFAALGAAVVFGAGIQSATGTLSEAWVSDTPRENTVNHHAVGAGPDGDVVVAPVAEVPNADVPITHTSCALVELDPADGATAWRAGVPAENCTTHALTEPAIDDADGSVAWRFDLGATDWQRPAVWAAPIVTDVDGDGAAEVLVRYGRARRRAGLHDHTTVRSPRS